MSTVVCRRVRLTGTVEVALPPEQAFVMFTPSGERTWRMAGIPASQARAQTKPIQEPSFGLSIVAESRYGRWFAAKLATRSSTQSRHRKSVVDSSPSPAKPRRTGRRRRSVTTSRHSAARRTLSSTGSRRTTRRSSLTGNAPSPRPFGLEVERPHAISQRHQQPRSGAPSRLSSCEPDPA